MSREISLTHGLTAIVDDADYDAVSGFKWFAFKHGHTYYARRTLPKGPDGKDHKVLMHRQLLGMSPGGVGVDHINGHGFDNRRENLRPATPKQNQRNQTRRRVGCSSRYKGVSWRKDQERWVAYIADGPKRPDSRSAKLRHLGFFSDEAAAARAYDAAAKVSFGEFAALNFPDDRSIDR